MRSLKLQQLDKRLRIPVHHPSSAEGTSLSTFPNHVIRTSLHIQAHLACQLDQTEQNDPHLDEQAQSFRQDLAAQERRPMGPEATLKTPRNGLLENHCRLSRRRRQPYRLVQPQTETGGESHQHQQIALRPEKLQLRLKSLVVAMLRIEVTLAGQ